MLRLVVFILQPAQFAEESMCTNQVDSVLYQLSNTALPDSSSHAHPASVPPSIHKYSYSWKIQHSALFLLTLFLCKPGCCSKHIPFHLLLLPLSSPTHSKWYCPELILSYQLLQPHHLPLPVTAESCESQGKLARWGPLKSPILGGRILSVQAGVYSGEKGSDPQDQVCQGT